MPTDFFFSSQARHGHSVKQKSLQVLARELLLNIFRFFTTNLAITYQFCPFSCSQSSDMSVRRAKHAGSWYSSNARELNNQLDGWLSNVKTVYRPARAIIAPHAGYSYCGSCGAYAYKQVDPARIKRVFILGPSHHVLLNGCAITGSSTYNTPLYNLEVDKEVNEQLLATGLFEKMSRSTDEDEHSIELHLPYIAKTMESKRHQYTIVPILVGSLSPEKERQYGKLLSKYLLNPENLFVVSSDFCHWGKRFHYFYHDETRYEHIHESIEALDKKGMDYIEGLDAAGFSGYIKKYGNTICGRYPIGVFLNAVADLQQLNGLSPKMSFRFLKYSQSNQCKDFDDSSVSYAAGVLLMS